MMEWYFLLTPFAVLAVLLLFGFVGCDELFGLEELRAYALEVEDDDPVINLRLRDSTATEANNEVGPPNGTYVLSPVPIDAGDPNWKSTEVQLQDRVLETGVSEDPKLLPTDPDSTHIRVRGAWVDFPSNWPTEVVDPLTEFTLEAIVFPEWNLEDLGKYYCLMQVARSNQFGFGIYAGPDSDAMEPPYTWQFWVGTPTGFQRFDTKKPYQDPNDPGPTLEEKVTYLAVTFSQSPSRAFLYMYYPDRDVGRTTYELVPVPYVPFEGRLTIGISAAIVGPLFPPITPTHVLYPFWGRIAEVAIYNKALQKKRILEHGKSVFYTQF
jgi:hypothetical protein